jgi:hypothetical protein
VDDTLDKLKDSNYYTHLHLAHGFWQVRVREEDIHKTVLHTHDGLMEWIAMLVELCNVPGTFHPTMNDILLEFLRKFVTVYLDDICVYIPTLDEFHKQKRLVLQ